MLTIFAVSGLEFYLHSPWLAITTMLALAVSIVWTLTSSRPGSEKATRLAVIFALCLVPIAMEMVSEQGLFIRSMVYIPYVLLALISFALVSLRNRHQLIVKVLAACVAVAISLTVVTNATVMNRLFSSGAIAYSLDQQLAFAIGVEKDRLVGTNVAEAVPLAVSGIHNWHASALLPRKGTFGGSFFEWEGGSTTRVAAFLRGQGVRVVPLTDEAAIARAEKKLASMPTYPQDGWVDLEDGVLLVNLGND